MIEKMWAEGDCIELTLPMIVRVAEAAPECRDYCGKIAVCRGPMVYCVESEDCDGQTVVRDVRIHTDAPFTVKEEMICGRELPVIYAKVKCAGAAETFIKTFRLSACGICENDSIFYMGQ